MSPSLFNDTVGNLNQIVQPKQLVAIPLSRRAARWLEAAT